MLILFFYSCSQISIQKSSDDIIESYKYTITEMIRLAYLLKGNDTKNIIKTSSFSLSSHNSFPKRSLSYNFSRALKLRQKDKKLERESQKKKKLSQEEIIPEQLYKELQDILPDSRWIKWMKLYLLMSRHYTDIWKIIAFFLTGAVVFGFYSVYFLTRNPKIFNIKSIIEEEIQNAAISNIMENLRTELYSKFSLWKKDHKVIKSFYHQILIALKMDPNEAYKHFRSEMNLNFIQSFEQDCFSSIFLYQLFNMANFQELLANQRFFFLKISKPPQHQKQKNIIKQLKIVIKGIKEVIKENTRKKLRHNYSSSCSMILIIDQVQELAGYLGTADKKKELLEVFHNLKELQNSGEVNVFAVSYDSLFFNDLIAELKEKQQNFTITQHQRVDPQTIKTIVKNTIQNHEVQEGLSNIFGIFLTQVNNMHNLSMLLEVPRVCRQNNWRYGHPADTAADILPKITEIRERRERNIREELKRAVFKGNQTECNQKIRLLIKLLLYYSDCKLWKDQDLAIQSLSLSQLPAYRDLCRQKILFYLNFYKKEYEASFFSIIKQNVHYHSLFKEEYLKMKQQEEVQSTKAHLYYAELLEKQRQIRQNSDVTDRQ